MGFNAKASMFFAKNAKKLCFIKDSNIDLSVHYVKLCALSV